MGFVERGELVEAADKFIVVKDLWNGSHSAPSHEIAPRLVVGFRDLNLFVRHTLVGEKGLRGAAISAIVFGIDLNHDSLLPVS